MKQILDIIGALADIGLQDSHECYVATKRLVDRMSDLVHKTEAYRCTGHLINAEIDGAMWVIGDNSGSVLMGESLCKKVDSFKYTYRPSDYNRGARIQRLSLTIECANDLTYSIICNFTEYNSSEQYIDFSMFYVDGLSHIHWEFDTYENKLVRRIRKYTDRNDREHNLHGPTCDSWSGNYQDGWELLESQYHIFGTQIPDGEYIPTVQLLQTLLTEEEFNS